MDKIEKTFVVAAPRERVWSAFTDSAECSQWQATVYEIDPRPGGRIHYEFSDGTTNDGTVEEVDPGRLLRHREPHGPGQDTEVTIQLESAEGGTRVSLSHAGFGEGEGWAGVVEATSLAWTQAFADLIVYLEQGVSPRRFVSGFLDPGLMAKDTPGGVEVLTVAPGRFADRAGVRSGDLLVKVGGAAVYTTADLWALMGGRRPGEEVTIEYLRGAERLMGNGVLTPW